MSPTRDISRFRTMAQLPTESDDQFITRLREMTEYCEFGHAKDENIRDQVIKKCMPSRLRRKFLGKEKGLSLQQLQNTANSTEASNRQARAIENSIDKEELKGGLNSVQEKPEGKRCYRCNMTSSGRQAMSCQRQRKPEISITRKAILQSAVKLKRRKIQMIRSLDDRSQKGQEIPNDQLIRLTLMTAQIVGMRLPLSIVNSLWSR